jgi:hypothetical protein
MRWENCVVAVQYDYELVDEIKYVQFRVNVNKGAGCFNVRIYADTSPNLPWYERILCSCNWTLSSGRPCAHASFCIRFPNLDNKLPKEKFFAHFSTHRKIFYSNAHSVNRMIHQYSSAVIFPEWDHLVPETIFPWEFLAQSGTY